MNYLRSLFLNFLIVFFINRMAPGIEITRFDNVPNIGADLLFSLVVGFLNASVYPFLFILELKPTLVKLGLFTFVVSYASYGAIAIFPFGVQVVTPAGFFLASTIVWGVALLANYLELRHDRGIKL
ncbi:MAG: phage holin family protein [Verrucomicrobiota bacterium]|nr:phage holin family protein [Verrucomicrobiota bacterium]